MMKKDFKMCPVTKFVAWLILGLVVCIIGISNVFADEISFQVYDYQVYYDNSGSSVSQVGQSWVTSFMAYVSNNITTTANSYGAGVVINSGIPIISGHAYSLSLFFEERHNIALSSKNRIAIGSSVSNSASNYANSNYNATMLTSKVINNTTLQFAFTANSSNQFIFIPWTTTSTTTQTYVFTSYIINDLGASSGVSQSDINNSLNSQTNILNQSITNSQNAIIQNQNQNRDAIIQNQDTNSTNNANIDNNNLQVYCSNIYSLNLTKGKKISNDGSTLVDDNTFYYTDYIPIGDNTSRVFSFKNGANSNVSGNFIFFYDNNKSLLDYFYLRETNRTAPSGTSYFRISTQYVGINVFSGANGCINKLDETNNNLSNILGNLTNTDEATFDSSMINLIPNAPITNLLTIPISLMQNILTRTNNSCSPISIPFLYNNTIDFPCFTLSDYLGTASNIIDMCICFVMIYNILMLFVSVFEDITSLRDEFHTLYAPRQLQLKIK